MNDSNLLTIFVVTYNRADYLLSCINSILNQSYTNFKLIILDNASTDNTADVINSFEDQRIHYIRHNKNMGGINNINFAINYCDTKYFVIFHDDDIMNTNFIESEISMLENHSECSLVCSLCSYINSEGEQIDQNENEQIEKVTLFKGDEYIKYYLSSKQYIICPTVMYRNSFVKDKNLLFSLEVGPAADQYFWFEVEKNGGVICRINEELIKYRVHSLQDSKINSIIMVTDLLYAIRQNIVTNYNVRSYHLLQKFTMRFSISISRKYAEKKLPNDIYIDIMNKLISICRSRRYIFLLKVNKLISRAIPNFIAIFYSIVVNTRKIKKMK